MNAVLLDAGQMDATATAISAHAAEVEAAAHGLEGVGASAVPPSLAGWLENELADIATTVRVTAVLYLVSAMDTMMRAEAIRTNQSLATAVTAPGSTSVAFTDSVMGGFSSYGSPVASISDLTGGSLPPASGFLLGASGPNTPLGGYTPALGGGSRFGGTGSLLDTYDPAIANLLAPDGLSAAGPGVFVDSAGREGPINRAYRNPRTGDMEIVR